MQISTKILGIDDSVYCECSSRIGHTRCKALSRVDQKELQSYEFNPKPIDVSDECMSKLGLKLNEKIIALSEMISVNMHEEWSLEKVANGWIYNAIRDDDKLHHNCLVPPGISYFLRINSTIMKQQWTQSRPLS